MLFYTFSFGTIVLETKNCDENIKLKDHEIGCRGLFLAISLSSLFVYFLIISLTDYINKEKIPLINANFKAEKLTKYLTKFTFGKWTSNFNFDNTLIVELNSKDKKNFKCTFEVPLKYFIKFMDYVGTKKNPYLKSTKIYLKQIDFGLISSLKISLKNLRNTSSIIYIETIEFLKSKDDKSQVLNIKKYINISNKPLLIDFNTEFKKKSKVITYNGYFPYFTLSDYVYFFLNYLNLSFFLLVLGLIQIEFKNQSKIEEILLDSLVTFFVITLIILIFASIYLFIIRKKLSQNFNSENLSIFNVIILVIFFIFTFFSGFFICEKHCNVVFKNQMFIYKLIFTQFLFPFTSILLWCISYFFYLRSIKSMIVLPNDVKTKLEDNKFKQSDSKILNKSSIKSLNKSNTKSLLKDSASCLMKNSAKSSTNSKINEPKMNLVKKSSLVKESSIKRSGSDNSIGSGYYNQMLNATKNVRSISQYGELLK